MYIFLLLYPYIKHVGITLNLMTRLRPVDHHVPTQPITANLREMDRPAPSGAGEWPKSKPFVVCVG